MLSAFSTVIRRSPGMFPIAANRALAGTFDTRRQFSDKPKDNSKAGKKKAAGDGEDDTSKVDWIDDFINVSEKIKHLKLEFPPEVQAEHTRILNEYNRRSFIRRNKMEQDLTNKIWLQQEALAALPALLQEKALVIDESPPPRDRPWPAFQTPPIKDFKYSDYFKDEDDEDSDESKGGSTTGKR